MKKIISLVAFIFLICGCSCNKDVYKFDSFTIEVAGEITNYTCSKKEKEDETVKSMCEGFEGMKITFKDDDTLKIDFPNFNINEEEEYKIENGYLFLKDEGVWEQFATYSKDKIVISYNYATVTLKK